MPVITLPTLTIAQAATASNIIGVPWFNELTSLAIHGPASLAGAVTVEVADTHPDSAVDADFRTLQSGGSDVVITAGDTTVLTELAFRSLRLKESVAPGAGGEVFDVTGQEY